MIFKAINFKVSLLGWTFLLLANTASADNLIYWSTISANVPPASGTIQRGYQDGSILSRDAGGAVYSREKDPCGIALDSSTGKIYWGEVSNGGIRVGNVDGTGEALTLFNEGRVCGVAIDPKARKIYWAKPDMDVIRMANLDGSGPIVTLYTEPVGSTPTGLVVDPEEQKIYWTNRRAHQVRSGDLYGRSAAQTLFSNEMGAVGVALDKSSGKLYWASFFTGQIRVGSTSGGQASTLFSGESPAGIAIDAQMQRIYWGNFLTGEIRVGNLNGSLAPATIVATKNRASFPILLQKPLGQKPPLLSSDESSNVDGKKVLTCTKEEFASDIAPSFLYREPSHRYYTWFQDGRQISGSINNSIMVSEPGDYVCGITGLNAAGAVTLLSETISILAPEPAAPVSDQEPIFKM